MKYCEYCNCELTDKPYCEQCGAPHKRKSGVVQERPFSEDDVFPQNSLDFFDPDEYVLVTSTLNHQLNLTTESHGMGRIYKFMELGETKRIFYKDLEKILDNHRGFFKKGYFKLGKRA